MLLSSVPFLRHNSDQRLVILVVEDSDHDFVALTRSLKQCAFTQPLYRVSNGEEALDYLHRRGDYGDPIAAPRPTLILVDLNLPGMDGREVIRQVKQDDALKHIPVIALTSSANAKDIELCYRYGANSYMLKPIGVELFQANVRTLLQYWFHSSVLPENEPPL
ncbi:MAG: response regulator [Lyngbya sp. HA4199-MV5]|jgi:CheY-like chemotaxis protein|nr:response regulator [Lyngbya sp. HA4199-MV5]